MPLTVIRASAGTGKTFQLAMSFIRILLAGELAGQPRNPAAILATTFTRAAAGEILDRVLRLVAEAVLSKSRREFLSSQLGLPLSAAHCARLLASLTAHMDRLAISTMDAFFGQIAKAFSSDLGFAPDWSMAANEAEADLLRRTLHTLLGATDHRSLGAALWTFRRAVISSMLGGLRELAPQFSTASFPIANPTNPTNPADDAPQLFAEPLPRCWSSEEVAPAAKVLADCAGWIPRNKGDKNPVKTWQGALEKITTALQPDGVAITLLDSTLVQRILSGGDFQRHPIPPECRDALRPLIDSACEALRTRHLARADALRWIGTHYARHRRTENFAGGAYTFGDVATMVTAAALGCDDLYFRIGTRYEHVLFDEFQDTSRLQFRFFQPIIEEVGSTGGEVLIVGDVKQAIYGWRGSDRALMHAPLRELGARIGTGGEKTLDQSFRSSSAVLAAVNRAFGRLRDAWLGGDVRDKGTLESAGQEWAAEFPEHRPAENVKNLQGRVRLLAVANEPEGNAESHRQALVAKTLELVNAHLAEDPQRKIAVLLRRNALMPRLIAALRRAHPEVDVSGEGGNPLTDSRAVEIILGMLTWLDHPGSTAAHHLVTQSPLAGVFGFAEAGPPARDGEENLARGLRRRIMERGYAPVLGAWIRHPAFPASCSDHDLQRCEQLLEVAREFDAGAPGRLSEFVAHVRARRVERPGGSGVRVMTIHVSKGLEFEAVILVDIDSQSGGHGTPILHDPDGTFHIVPSKEQALLMGLDDLVQRHIREDFIEELSVLYVAMTRARSFLDIVLRDTAKTPVAMLLRAALLPVGVDGMTEECAGAPFRAEPISPLRADVAPEDRDPGVAGNGAVDHAALTSTFGRTVHVTPSGSSDRGDISIARLLSPMNRAAMRRGEFVHEWLRQIAWIDDGIPDVESWIAPAMETARETERRDIAAWARALAAEAQASDTELHRALSRPAANARETIELWRERRFAVVRGNEGRNEVVSGSFDRVVIWHDANGKALRAEIVDFKTDRCDSTLERAQIEARYAPQLDTYRDALCLLCRELNRSTVSTSLILVSA